MFARKWMVFFVCFYQKEGARMDGDGWTLDDDLFFLEDDEEESEEPCG